MAGEISLDDSYDDFPRIEEAFQQFLDESLAPRGPESVFDVVESLDLPADGLAVDVGCGEGRDAVQLAQRFGLRVLGVDPVPRHLELAPQRRRMMRVWPTVSSSGPGQPRISRSPTRAQTSSGARRC